MNHPTPKRLLAALAAGLLLSACTGGTTDIPKTIETPILTDVKQLKSPLTPYFRSPEERELISKATRRYEEQCAQRFGVTLPPEEIDPAEEAPDEAYPPNLTGRYPAFSREQVETRIGHGSAEDGMESEDGMEEGKGDDITLSPEEERIQEVSYGKTSDGSRSTLKDSEGNPVPEHGCGTEGWQRVLGDVPHDYDTLLNSLLGEALSMAETDPRYIEAEKEWSACMRKAGYEFEHPQDASNSVAGKDVEIQRDVEFQSVDCVKEVNLAGRMMAIDIEYQYKLIKENEAQLRDVLDKKKKLLNNAKEALK